MIRSSKLNLFTVEINVIETDFGPEMNIVLKGQIQLLTDKTDDPDYLTLNVYNNETATAMQYNLVNCNESRMLNLKVPTELLASPLYLNLDFSTKSMKTFSFELSIDKFPLDPQIGAILAGIIVLVLNILIVFEVCFE